MIRTREEALGYLEEASPRDLRASAKRCVDGRIKEVLSTEDFDAIDPEVQQTLHTNMLKIRSSFWTDDPNQLSEGKKGLRELWESGRIASAAANRQKGEELEARVLALVEEARIALALRRCMSAREKDDGKPAEFLACLLKGG